MVNGQDVQQPSFLQQLVRANVALSSRFDRLLPENWRIDGMMDFLHRIVPQMVGDGDVVADLGSGKMPAISVAEKTRHRLRVIGIDIDAGELARAPAGSYDETIVADLTLWRGSGQAEIAICSAVLEHVRDTGAALAAIASVLKPGGRALIFCPCRNAAFARLNLVLPQRIKIGLLDLLYGGGHGVGFPAYYDRCTLGEFRSMATAVGLRVDRLTPYYMSTYFMVLTPLHLMWRAYQRLAVALIGEDACESFILVAVKD